MARVLLVADERFLGHDAGAGHPERPQRLGAVLAGVADAGLDDDLVAVAPRFATTEELTAVHAPEHVAAIEAFCAAGGGYLDPDTAAVPASWDAARLAAGAGLEAVERLRVGEADAAFCAVRPPGHHARPDRAMGFCLFNSLAITAATLADAGERVLVVDYDAHHGNGTQEAFWSDGRVAFVSLHQWPLYPGTGALDDLGAGDGLGATVNMPLPAGATGDAYLAAVDEVVAPLAAAFAPTWLLLSAGFDAHRADPITGLGLAAGDYVPLTARLAALVPAAGSWPSSKAGTTSTPCATRPPRASPPSPAPRFRPRPGRAPLRAVQVGTWSRPPRSAGRRPATRDDGFRGRYEAERSTDKCVECERDVEGRSRVIGRRDTRRSRRVVASKVSCSIGCAL